MNREIMKQAGFGAELELIDKGLCPTCHGAVGEFRDELSRKEFGISGMCQKCQDSIFDHDPDDAPPEEKPFEPAHGDHVGLDGDVFIVDQKYRMFSGAAEAAKFIYHKLVDKQGHVWLYPANSDSPAEQVHFHNPKDLKSDGYGGATLHFVLEDGTTYAAKGPWHSSADAMFEATGVDIRNTHYTYGCVSLKRVYVPSTTRSYYDSVTRFEGVLHADKEPVLGRFSRLTDLAKEHATRLGHPVAYYSQSKGGSSSGWEVPAGTEWKSWNEWFKGH